MSKTIDQKVVEMRFDNAQFEKGARDTMTTLQKLKESLNFGSSVKGFTNINNAIKSLDFHPVSNSVDLVEKKFSALETVAVGALLKIGSQAVTAGEQLLKSLTLDNISEGWDKFGKKTVAVGTLISQGFDMSTVEAQLSRLNWFTDETSYNFTDMVDSIGKFTATGKGLEESVTAMEGIALWAALSGQNAQKASSAMYQLSQAMSKGVLKYDDWKSIANVAMDTNEFRKIAAQAAVELGTLKNVGDDTFKTLKGKIVSLNDLFSSEYMSKQAWFTSDVMMNVFNKYSSAVNEVYKICEDLDVSATQVLMAKKKIDESEESFREFCETERLTAETTEDLKAAVLTLDEFGVRAFRAGQEARTWADVVDSVKDAVSTGWMNTFEIIFGNYEEAVELFTDLSMILWDVFAAGGEARNEILEMWKALGGRKDVVEAFYNIVAAIKNIAAPIRELWDSIFPPITAKRIYDITHKIKELSQAFLEQSKAIAKGEGAWSDIAAVIKAIATPLKIVTELLKLGVSLIPSILNLVGNLASVIIRVSQTITFMANEIMLGIVKTNDFKIILDSIVRIGSSVVTIVSRIAGAFTSLFAYALNNPNISLLQAFRDILLRITAITLDGIASGLEALANLDFSKIKDFPEKFAEGFKKLAAQSPIIDVIYKGLSKLYNFVLLLWDALKGFFGTLVDRLKDVHSFSDLLEVLKDTFKDLYDRVIQFVKGDAFSGLRKVFKDVGEDASKFFTAMKESISKIDGSDIILVAFAAGLVAALINIGSALTTFGQLMISFKNMIDTANSTVKKIFGLTARMKELKEITFFIATLAASLVVLSFVPVDNLKAVALVLGLLGAEFLTFAAIMAKIHKNNIFTGIAIKDMVIELVALAGGLAALAGAVLLIKEANITIKEFGPVLFELVTALAALTVAVISIGKFAPNLTASTIGIAGVGAGLLAMSYAIERLGAVNFVNVEGTIGSVLAVCAGLSLISAAAKDVKFATFAGISMMCVALTFLMPDIINLAKTDITDSVMKVIEQINGIIKLVGVLTGMASIITAINTKVTTVSKQTKKTKSKFKEFADGLVEIAVAVGLLVVSISYLAKQFAKMDAETKSFIIYAEEATGVVLTLVTILGLISKLATVVTKTKESKEFVKFPSNIAMIAMSVAALAGAVVIMSLAFKNMEDGGPIVAALGVIASVTILTGSLIAVSKLAEGVDAKPIIAMFAGFATILGSLAVVSLLIGALDNSFWAAVAVTAGEMVTLGFMMYMVSENSKKCDFKPILAVTAGIATMIAGLIAVSITISKLKPEALITALVVMFLALTELCITIGVVSALTKNIDMKPLLGIAAALVAVGVAFAAVMLSMPKENGFWTLVASAVAIGGVAAAVGKAASLAKDADFSTLLGMAIMLVTIAGSLALVLVAMPDEGGIGRLITAAGAIAGVALFVGGAAKLADGVNWTTLAGMAAVVVLVAGSLAVLGLLDIPQIIAAAAAIVVVTGALVGLGAISGIPVVAAGIGVLETALVALAATIVGTAASIAMIGVVVDAFMVIVLLLIKTFISMLENADKLGKGIITLAKSIGTGIESISKSVGNGITSIAAGIGKGILVISATVNSGIITIASGISSGIIMIANSVRQGGVILASAGSDMMLEFLAGVKRGAAAFLTFPMDLCAEFINNLMNNSIVSNMKRVAEAFITDGFMAGIREALDWHSPPGWVKEYFGDQGEALWNNASAAVGDFFKAGGSMGGALVDGVKDGTSGLYDIIPDWAKTVGQQLGLIKSQFSNINIVRNDSATKVRRDANGNPIVNSAADAQLLNKEREKNNEYGILDQLKDAFSSVGDGATAGASGMDAFSESAGKAGKASKETKSTLDELTDSISGQMDIFSEFNKEVDITGEEILNNMKSQIEGVTEWSTQIAQLAIRGVDEGLLKKLADMGPQGYKYTSAFVNMTQEQLAQANMYYQQSLIIPVGAASTIEKSFLTAGHWASEGFKNGIDPKAAVDNMKKLAKESYDALATYLGIASPSTKMKEAGFWSVEGYRLGIDENADMAVVRMQYFAQDLCNKASTILTYDQGKQTSGHLMSGLKRGIANGESEVINEIQEMARRTIEAANRAFQIKSPSRVFAGIGEFIDLGLAKGIKDNTDPVITEMEKLKTNLVDQYDDMMTAYENYITKVDSPDIPNVSAVVDFNKTNRTETFSTGSLNLSDSVGDKVSAILNAINDRRSEDTAKQDSFRNKVFNEVQNLRNDITGLGSKIASMQMVLDTGTLVGEITPGVDQELGNLMAIKSRGI